MKTKYLTKFFVWSRFYAILCKEFTTVLRDPATSAMIIGVPIMQLLLFGYAINTHPKHLPTALVTAEQTYFVHKIISQAKNTEYFDFIGPLSRHKANELMAEEKVQFIFEIPPNFTEQLLQGKSPSLLLTADNTDALATAAATAAMQQALKVVFDHEHRGPILNLKNPLPKMNLVVHKRYNPLDKTRYTLVPGLLGVTLTMTLVMVTSGQIAKEYETGTMEMLLATPLRPMEVLIAKIVPYMLVGYLQMTVILLVMTLILHVPFFGHWLYLYIGALPFIACNLAVGIMLSTFAKNQIQAMVTSIFFFLPSMLLTGFMFPFRGMPTWAQWLGEGLPMTHFIRISRGVVLKNMSLGLVFRELVPIIIFSIIVLTIAVRCYRSTID